MQFWLTLTMRNKIFFSVVLAFMIVGAIFYFFSIPNEISQTSPQKNFSPTNNSISVYISGQVKNPAVITFEKKENLKIIDAVNAAGGFTESADTENINLAENLSDGQHIHVPTKEIIFQEISAPTSSKNKNSNEVVNINTADENELQKIRGVGPSIAQRIIDFREQNGNFQSIEDIKKVRGIGEKTFQKIKNSITVK